VQTKIETRDEINSNNSRTKPTKIFKYYYFQLWTRHVNCQYEDDFFYIVQTDSDQT